MDSSESSDEFVSLQSSVRKLTSSIRLTQIKAEIAVLDAQIPIDLDINSELVATHDPDYHIEASLYQSLPYRDHDFASTNLEGTKRILTIDDELLLLEEQKLRVDLQLDNALQGAFRSGLAYSKKSQIEKNNEYMAVYEKSKAMLEPEEIQDFKDVLADLDILANQKKSQFAEKIEKSRIQFQESENPDTQMTFEVEVEPVAIGNDTDIKIGDL